MELKSYTQLPGDYARRMRRLIFRRNDALLRKLLLDPSGQIDSYYQSYRASFAGSRPVPVHRFDAVREFRDREIVVLGDFHTYDRVPAAALDLAEELGRRGGRLALALEIFSIRHQPELDAFLEGRLTLDELRTASRFGRIWGDGLWGHYVPLLAWARRRNIPVAGINMPGESLEARDRAAADAVARLRRLDPDRQIAVLIGELHTAPDHLPRLIREATGLSPAILHQSAEPIAWRLERRGITDEWVRLSRDRYARVLAHPVVHQSTFTYHVMSGDHAEAVENWERAFRFVTKRLGDIAGLDFRPLLELMHVQAMPEGGIIRIADADGLVPPLEADDRPDIDRLAALAGRAVVRFSRYLASGKRLPPDTEALGIREEAAAHLAELWVNPLSARDLVLTRPADLAFSIDRSLAAGELSPALLRNLFLGTGYPLESDRDLLVRIERAALEAPQKSAAG